MLQLWLVKALKAALKVGFCLNYEQNVLSQILFEGLTNLVEAIVVDVVDPQREALVDAAYRLPAASVP